MSDRNPQPDQPGLDEDERSIMGSTDTTLPSDSQTSPTSFPSPGASTMTSKEDFRRLLLEKNARYSVSKSSSSPTPPDSKLEDSLDEDEEESSAKPSASSSNRSERTIARLEDALSSMMVYSQKQNDRIDALVDRIVGQSKTSTSGELERAVLVEEAVNKIVSVRGGRRTKLQIKEVVKALGEDKMERVVPPVPADVLGLLETPSVALGVMVALQKWAPPEKVADQRAEACRVVSQVILPEDDLSDDYDFHPALCEMSRLLEAAGVDPAFGVVEMVKVLRSRSRWPAELDASCVPHNYSAFKRMMLAVVNSDRPRCLRMWEFISKPFNKKSPIRAWFRYFELNLKYYGWSNLPTSFKIAFFMSKIPSSIKVWELKDIKSFPTEDMINEEDPHSATRLPSSMEDLKKLLDSSLGWGAETCEWYRRPL